MHESKGLDCQDTAASVWPSSGVTRLLGFGRVAVCFGGTFFAAVFLILLVVPSESGRAADRAPRILDGKRSSTAVWPFIASLSSTTETHSYWGHFCGGSLIAPRWVLTAAHCVDALRPRDLDVVINRSNLKKKTGARVAVTGIIRHPDAVWGSPPDVALLFLGRRVESRAIPLAYGRPGDGSIARIAGWGATRTSFPAKLRAAHVPVVSDRACANAYSAAFEPEYHVCAGWAEGGRDTCQGDSGGPLVVGGSLVGITSFGAGCGRPGAPGVYTKIPAIRPWVMEQIRQHPKNVRPRSAVRDLMVEPRPVAGVSIYFSYPDIDSPVYGFQVTLDTNYAFGDLRVSLRGSSGPWCLDFGACFASGEWFTPPLTYGRRAADFAFRSGRPCPTLRFKASLKDRNSTSKQGSLEIC